MQSRFLALISNGDELRKNIEIAENSDDTGTLQALESLDSLESKINQVQVAYQQFYTNIGVEGIWKSGLEGLRNFIDNLNDLPKMFDKIPAAAVTILYDAINLIKTAAMAGIQNIAQLMINHMNSTLPEQADTVGVTTGTRFVEGFKKGMSTIKSTLSGSLATIKDSFGFIGNKITGKSTANIIPESQTLGNALNLDNLKGSGQQQLEAIYARAKEINAELEKMSHGEILFNLDSIQQAQKELETLGQTANSIRQGQFGRDAKASTAIYNGILAQTHVNSLNDVSSATPLAAYSEPIVAQIRAAQELENKFKSINAFVWTSPGRLAEQLRPCLEEAEKLKAEYIQLKANTPGDTAGLADLEERMKNLTATAEEYKNRMMAIQNARSSMSQLGSALRLVANTMNTATRSAEQLSGIIMMIGGTLSVLSMQGPMAVVTGIMAIYSGIERWHETAQERADRLAKEAEQLTNEAKNQQRNYKTFKESKENLEELEEQRYDSTEAAEEYQQAVDKLAEAYPQLITSINEAGEVTVESANLEYQLEQARTAAADATLKAAQAEREAVKQQIENNKNAQKADRQTLKNSGFDTQQASLITADEYEIVRNTANSNFRESLQSNTANYDLSYNQALIQALYRYAANYENKDKSTGLVFNAEEALAYINDIEAYNDYIASLRDNSIISEEDFEIFNKIGLAYEKLGTITDEKNNSIAEIRKDIRDLDVDSEDFQNKVSEIVKKITDDNLHDFFPAFLNAYNDYEQGLIEGEQLENALKATEISEVSALVKNYGKGQQELIEKLGNNDNILIQYIYSKLQEAEDQEAFLDATTGEWKQYYDGFAEDYNKIGYYQQEKFKELWKNRKSYTAQDLIQQLNLDETGDFASAIFAYYENNFLGVDFNAGLIENKIKSQFSDTSLTTEIDSFLQSITDIKDILTVDFTGWITDAIDIVKDYQNKGLTENGNDFIQGLNDLLTTLNSITDVNDLITARQIIMQGNLRTVGGIEQIQQQLHDAGISNFDAALATMREALVYNLPLAIQTYTDELLNEIENFEKQIKNVSNGMTFSEASEALQKINESLDETEKRFTLSDFKIKNGKLYFKDNNDLQDKYFQVLTEDLEEEYEAIEAEIGKLGSSDNNYKNLLQQLQQNLEGTFDIEDFGPLYYLLESLDMVEVAETDAEGHATQFKVNAEQISKILESNDLVDALMEILNAKLGDARQALNYATSILPAEAALETGQYQKYIEYLTNNVEGYKPPSLEMITSGVFKGDDIINYDQAKALQDKVNEELSNFINDALSKGIENINLEDYLLDGIIDQEDFINDKQAIKQGQMSYKQFANKYIDLLNLTTDEANKYLVQAIEKDNYRQIDASDALKNIVKTNTGIMYGSIDDIEKLANALGIELTDILGEYSSELEAYTIKTTTLTPYLDKIEGAKELLVDSTRDFIEELVEALGTALSGEMTFSDVTNFKEKLLAFGLDSDYVESLNFYETVEGLKLSNQQAAELHQKIAAIDSIAGRLSFSTLKDSLTETGGELENVVDTTATIAELREKITKNEADLNYLKTYDKNNEQRIKSIEKENKALKEQLSLYQQIQREQAMEPESYDFMDNKLPDPFQGPLNYWESLGDMMSAMDSAGKTGRMKVQDFYNIVNQMNNLAKLSGNQLQFMGETLDGSAESAASLISKGFSALDNVDGKGVMINLQKIGLQFSEGAEGLGEGFEDSIHSMAQSQIDMLDAMIQLLETVVAMEKLGDIDIDDNGILDFGELFSAINYEDTSTQLYQATQQTQKTANEILTLASTDTDLATALDSVKMGDKTIRQMMTDLAKGTELTKEQAEQYQAAFQSLYSMALSGDYDLDNLAKSIADVAATTGFEGEIKIADGLTYYVGYGYVMQPEDNGTYSDGNGHTFNSPELAAQARFLAEQHGKKAVQLEEGGNPYVVEVYDGVEFKYTMNPETQQEQVEYNGESYSSKRDAFDVMYQDYFAKQRASGLLPEEIESKEEYAARIGIEFNPEIEVTNEQQLKKASQEQINNLSQALISGSGVDVQKAAAEIGIEVKLDEQGNLSAADRQQIADLAGIESKTVAVNLTVSAEGIDEAAQNLTDGILSGTMDASLDLQVTMDENGNVSILGGGALGVGTDFDSAFENWQASYAAIMHATSATPIEETSTLTFQYFNSSGVLDSEWTISEGTMTVTVGSSTGTDIASAVSAWATSKDIITSTTIKPEGIPEKSLTAEATVGNITYKIGITEQSDGWYAVDFPGYNTWYTQDPAGTVNELISQKMTEVTGLLPKGEQLFPTDGYTVLVKVGESTYGVVVEGTREGYWSVTFPGHGTVETNNPDSYIEQCIAIDTGMVASSINSNLEQVLNLGGTYKTTLTQDGVEYVIEISKDKSGYWVTGRGVKFGPYTTPEGALSAVNLIKQATINDLKNGILGDNNSTVDPIEQETITLPVIVDNYQVDLQFNGDGEILNENELHDAVNTTLREKLGGNKYGTEIGDRDSQLRAEEAARVAAAEKAAAERKAAELEIQKHLEAINAVKVSDEEIAADVDSYTRGSAVENAFRQLRQQQLNEWSAQEDPFSLSSTEKAAEAFLDYQNARSQYAEAMMSGNAGFDKETELFNILTTAWETYKATMETESQAMEEQAKETATTVQDTLGQTGVTPEPSHGEIPPYEVQVKTGEVDTTTVDEAAASIEGEEITPEVDFQISSANAEEYGNKMKETINNLKGDIFSSYDGTEGEKLNDTLTSIGTNYQNFLNAASQNDGNAMAGAFDALITDLQTLQTEFGELDFSALYTELEAYGISIPEGLTTGMESGEGAVSATSTTLAQAIVQALQAIIQKGSPSQMAQEFGTSIDEGLVVGMTQGSAAVQTTAQNVSQKITQVFTDMQTSLSQMKFDVFQNLIDSLTEIATQAETLSSTDWSFIAQGIGSLSGINLNLGGISPQTPVSQSYNTLSGTRQQGPLAQSRVEELSADGSNIVATGVTIQASGAKIEGLEVQNNNKESKDSSSKTPTQSQSTVKTPAKAENAPTPQLDMSGLTTALATLTSQSMTAGTNVNVAAQALTTAGTSALGSTAKINSLASAMGRIPTVSSRVSGLANAMSNLPSGASGIVSDLASAMQKISAVTISITLDVSVNASGPNISGSDVKGDVRGNYWHKSGLGAKFSASKAKGNLALAKGRKTLVGELGPELVVSNGHYYTVGNDGAEMVDLPQDAIVFNHLQTQRLLGNRRVNGRGVPVTTEKNAISFATGNVEGPAMASASAALAALKQIRAMWQSLLNASLSDLGSGAGSGGGGGSGGSGGKDNAGYIHDLQLWYNLTRQIDHLEMHITYEQTLQSKLQSDMVANGKALYDSYKRNAEMLEQQVEKQEQLSILQREQYYQRVADLQETPFSKIINYDDAGLMQLQQDLGKFIADATANSKQFSFDKTEVEFTPKGELKLKGSVRQYDEDGNLKKDKNDKKQYKTLTEKTLDLSQYNSALDFLSNLNATDPTTGATIYTADEQAAILKAFGFGEALKYDTKGQKIEEGDDDSASKTVEVFWEKLDGWMEELDSLYEAYHDSEEAAVKARDELNKVLQELIDNQIEVENAIVEAIEARQQAEIDNLKDEKDALDDATGKFIDGLSQQLDKERKMYEQQEGDRELTKMQRQLAILQRSGGSASQIRSLQEQIASKQQDSYFEAQQSQIDAIQEANDRQIEKLDEQISILEETLDYQKANGLFWEEARAIMQESPEDILAFIQENNPDYRSKSELQIAQDLRELKLKVETWTSERDDKDEKGNSVNLVKELADHDNWDKVGATLKEQYKDVWNFNNAGKNAQKVYQNTYAKSGDFAQSSEMAVKVLKTAVEEKAKADAAAAKEKTATQTKNTTQEAASQGKAKLTDYSTTTYKKNKNGSFSDSGHYGKKGEEVTVLNWNAGKTGSKDISLIKTASGAEYYIKKERLKKFKKGGLIDFTGPAWVDGSKTKPEGIVNAEQTKFMTEGFWTKVDSLTSELQKSLLAAYNVQTQTDVEANHGDIIIEKAEVNMNVESIANDYDARRAGASALEEMVKIARKTGGLGLSRR